MSVEFVLTQYVCTEGFRWDGYVKNLYFLVKKLSGNYVVPDKNIYIERVKYRASTYMLIRVMLPYKFYKYMYILLCSQVKLFYSHNCERS